MGHIVHTVGNRNPSLEETLKKPGVVDDLTGATVRFKMRLATSSTPKVDQLATIVNPPGVDGKVRYDWAAVDVDTSGFYVGWWEVTKSAKTQDTPEFLIEIRAHSPFTNALCTIDQVRSFLRKETDEVEQDSELQSLILAASDAILEHTGREFVPKVDNAVRVFGWDPCTRSRTLRLGPHGDLRNIDQIRLHPETAAPVLVAASEYSGWPLEKHHGVYTGVRLSPYLHAWSDFYERFGVVQVEVTGDWGFPAVPAAIEHWTKVTVATWLRRDVAAFTATFNLDEGRNERPDELPSAVVKGLARWRFAPFA